ncbi:MAG: FMN-binding protein [Actinomycetota bacterium]
MRTRAALGGIFASAAVLGIGWQFGHAAAASFAAQENASTASSSTTSSPSATPSVSPTSTPSATPSASAPAAASAASGTYTGASESTPFGNVQVQIVVSAGKITDVKALQLTDQGGRSVEISNYAAPILRSEVLKAQSAKVQNVSGATYTTEGYVSSAQSAIDKAHL